VNAWPEHLDDVDIFLAQEELQPAQRGGRPLFMLGHSHGALVLAAAVIRGLPGVDGCVLTAPYFRSRMHVPAHKVWLARGVNGVAGWLPVASGLKPEWMSSDTAMVEDSRADPLCLQHATPRWFLGSIQAQAEVRSHAADFRLPMQVLIGTADPIADPEAARQFVEDAGSTDKSYHEYPGLLHEILRETDRERVFTDILDWIQAR
jgi:alpha-beta hydrolase superfamily lysophospholipase